MDSDDYFEPDEGDKRMKFIAGEVEYVVSTFQEVSDSPEMIRQIRRDLNWSGLSVWNPFGPDTPEKFVETFYWRRATEFGEAFLDFITEPDLSRVDPASAAV